MRATPFTKMHGIGNDFVIIDARRQPVAMQPDRARRLADRHRGIGCDQLILLEPSPRADLFMRIFNPDGQEAEACGNASRCVARLVGGTPVIETRAGLVDTIAANGTVAIDMGSPRFGWADIPLAMAMDTLDLPVAWGPLERPAAVSMGNPHLIFFGADPAAVPLESLGPEIETDPLFPERINVNVAEVVAPDRISLRVWERGAGLTLACGSGASATFAAARRRRLVGPEIVVDLPGGTLELAETAAGTIRLAGPAETSFEGWTTL